MRTLSELLSNYVEYNPHRVYSADDYVIRYHGSYRSICLLRCIANGATGEFDRTLWAVVECVLNPQKVDLGRRAPYLGRCAENITYKVGTRPERLVPRLPRHEDLWLDNVTFPA